MFAQVANFEVETQPFIRISEFPSKIQETIHMLQLLDDKLELLRRPLKSYGFNSGTSEKFKSGDLENDGTYMNIYFFLPILENEVRIIHIFGEAPSQHFVDKHLGLSSNYKQILGVHKIIKHRDKKGLILKTNRKNMVDKNP